MVLSQNDVS